MMSMERSGGFTWRTRAEDVVPQARHRGEYGIEVGGSVFRHQGKRFQFQVRRFAEKGKRFRSRRLARAVRDWSAGRHWDRDRHRPAWRAARRSLSAAGLSETAVATEKLGAVAGP